MSKEEKISRVISCGADYQLGRELARAQSQAKSGQTKTSEEMWRDLARRLDVLL